MEISWDTFRLTAQLMRRSVIGCFWHFLDLGNRLLKGLRHNPAMKKLATCLLLGAFSAALVHVFGMRVLDWYETGHLAMHRKLVFGPDFVSYDSDPVLFVLGTRRRLVFHRHGFRRVRRSYQRNHRVDDQNDQNHYSCRLGHFRDHVGHNNRRGVRVGASWVDRSHCSRIRGILLWSACGGIAPVFASNLSLTASFVSDQCPRFDLAIGLTSSA